jgi:uncharacterized integral membrane protein
MIRKIVNVVIILPLAVIFLVFAVANRELVTLSFDPFNSSDPAVSVSLPLFVIMIAALITGLIVGGVATWIGQRHWRRAAKRHESEARTAREQLASSRTNALVPVHRDPQVPAIGA